MNLLNMQFFKMIQVHFCRRDDEFFSLWCFDLLVEKIHLPFYAVLILFYDLCRIFDAENLFNDEVSIAVRSCFKSCII
jgi:hypothetical protein